MVGYCLSAAAGVDLHMTAWLALTRASVIGFILSLSARKSELSVGPRAVIGAGNVVRFSRRAGVRVPERGAPEAAIVHGFSLRLLVFNLADQLVLRFAEGAGQVRVISNRY